MIFCLVKLYKILLAIYDYAQFHHHPYEAYQNLPNDLQAGIGEINNPYTKGD